MPDWDPSLYLKFSGERTRPAAELAGAVSHPGPARVLDVGCGPGNSTAVLAARFPNAQIRGVDASAAMTERARAACPGCSFGVCRLPEGLPGLGAGWDVIFSNACLQWVPGQRTVIPALYGLLAPGGVLAVQVPRQDKQPAHRLLRRLTRSPRWRDTFPQPQPFNNLSPEEYIVLLAGLTPDFRLWETTYYQIMPGHTALLEWYRGTALRPYLAQLSPADVPRFEADVLEGLQRLYPPLADGRVLFPFSRLFFTAAKSLST